MVGLIVNNRAEVIEPMSRTRTLFKIFYMGKNIYAVYDKNHQNFVTALPPDKYEKKIDLC